MERSLAQGFQRLPPARSLIAFEAAARNLSFTEAAKELNVTRVAVSRQVRQLENFLGVELFARGRSSITLTRVGRHLSRTIHDGLRSIVDEVESIENTKEDRLITIATTSGVSTYWLMPVIGGYRQIDPKADFRLLVSHDLVNLVQQDVDLAIRYGTGNWTGTTSVLLQRQKILPLCSQAFYSRHGPFRTIDELAGVPLLEFESAFDPSSIWTNYFRDKGSVISSRVRMSFYDSYINFVQAVLDGQGIGLMGAPLMQQFIDSGVLVPAMETEALPQHGYYLCQPEGASPSRTVSGFRDWLRNELGGGAEQDQAGMPSHDSA